MSELPFVFAPFSKCNRSAEDEALSTAWGAMFDGLLTSRQPGCAPSSARGGCVHWPAFDAAGQTMLLGNWYDHSLPLSSVVDDDALLSADMVGDGERKLASTCSYVDTIYWLPDARGRYWASNAAIPPAERTESPTYSWSHGVDAPLFVFSMLAASLWFSSSQYRHREQQGVLL